MDPTVYAQRDGCVIMHGDFRDAADIFAAATVMVTDPPYGVKFVGNGYGCDFPRGRVGAERKIAGDESTAARDAALELWGDERPALVFGSWRAPRPVGTRNIVTWCKGNNGAGLGDLTLPWGQGTEEIYVLGKKWVGRQGKRGLRFIVTDVCMSSRGGLVARVGHPTPKPVAELMVPLIERCPPGLILDPFLGSGSTLLAAHALGRSCIGLELDERYCEIAAERLMASERIAA